MNEIKAIEAITSIEQLKHKRANRRGHITRIQKKVTSSLSRDLRSLVKAKLDHNLKEARRQIDLETAIQIRIEELLAESLADLKTEQEEGEKLNTPTG